MKCHRRMSRLCSYVTACVTIQVCFRSSWTHGGCHLQSQRADCEAFAMQTAICCYCGPLRCQEHAASLRPALWDA